MNESKVIVLLMMGLVGGAALGAYATYMSGSCISCSFTETEPVVTTPTQRPERPDLDRPAECLWLTNQVVGPPTGHKVYSDQQLAFINTCTDEDRLDLEMCKSIAKDAWGSQEARRVKFFYECLKTIDKVQESTCCYALRECNELRENLEDDISDLEHTCRYQCTQNTDNQYSACKSICMVLGG